MKTEVIVIGGGPAGMMAAGQAAIQGAKVTILEKMPRPGRKLIISGKGRCNLTNACDLETLISHYGKAANFIKPAIYEFDNTKLIAFFKELGVETITERGNRVFPASGKAHEITDALLKWLKKLGVQIKTNHRVIRLDVKNAQIVGVVAENLTTSPPITTHFPADAVILATGGASYPATGSTGDGYYLAQAVGHTIIPIRPALTPLETYGDIASQLQGLSLKNVEAEIWCEREKVASKFGEMLFTHFGVSGPIILALSKYAVDYLNQKKRVYLKIDLKPALDETTLDQRILREFSNHPGMHIKNILKSLLPSRLIDVCIKECQLNPQKTGNQITSEERKRLRNWLKNFQLEISGYRPFEEAIITAGGIDLKEVDRYTMQSKLVKGLYFAGEILDIDAETGGFNLQAAFSTGYLAGKSCIKSSN